MLEKSFSVKELGKEVERGGGDVLIKIESWKVLFLIAVHRIWFVIYEDVREAGVPWHNLGWVHPGMRCISRDAVQSTFCHLDADNSDKISLTELAQTNEMAKLFFQESKCEYIVLAALIGLVHESRSRRESDRTPNDASTSVDRYREQPLLEFDFTVKDT